MPRSYAINANLTTPNSTTLPVVNVLATAAVRPTMYDIVVGAGTAVADNSAIFLIQRCSTAGTPAGSTTAPAPIDPGDPASTSTVGYATFTVGPTTGTTLLRWGQNQRATFRWIAAPGKELQSPSTAANGLAFMNTAVAATFIMDWTIWFTE